MVGCVPSACDGVPSAGLGQAPCVLMGWSLPALRQRGSWHDLPTTLLGSVIVPPPVLGSETCPGVGSWCWEEQLGGISALARNKVGQPHCHNVGVMG